MILNPLASGGGGSDEDLVIVTGKLGDLYSADLAASQMQWNREDLIPVIIEMYYQQPYICSIDTGEVMYFYTTNREFITKTLTWDDDNLIIASSGTNLGLIVKAAYTADSGFYSALCRRR